MIGRFKRVLKSMLNIGTLGFGNIVKGNKKIDFSLNPRGFQYSNKNYTIKFIERKYKSEFYNIIVNGFNVGNFKIVPGEVRISFLNQYFSIKYDSNIKYDELLNKVLYEILKRL